MSKKIVLWVDASFSQSDGSFAWGAIYEVDGERHKIGRGDLHCLNSAMAEAIGINSAMKMVAEIYPHASIDVRSDCQSIISLILEDSFTSNRELGRVISAIKKNTDAKFTFKWIKGHEQGWDTKNKANNKHADKYANDLRKKKVA
jgi:ribonuclease HI